MLNKEQMFILNEFVNKYATQNVWYVSDKMVDMVRELVSAGVQKVAEPQNEQNHEVEAV